MSPLPDTENAESPEADADDRRIALRAPAKINLGLRVLGSRPDGYHLLESVFVPLDLADELRLEISAGQESQPRVDLSLVRAGDARGVALGEIPADGSNLAARAALGFLAAAQLDVSVSIALVKRIPAGAGLGGGSSDAGAVLRGLATLYPAALSDEALAKLALSLGADVPFFLEPRAALVGGIGERIEPLEGLPELWLVLANPGESVATAQVYEIYDVLAATLTAVEPGSTMRAISGLRAAARESDEEALASSLGQLSKNDLESAAVRLCPPVGRVRRQLLESGALAVGMSGSGATLYGAFSSRSKAQAGFDGLAIEEPGWARLAVVMAGG